jgi:hypothetical protein
MLSGKPSPRQPEQEGTAQSRESDQHCSTDDDLKQNDQSGVHPRWVLEKLSHHPGKREQYDQGDCA